VHGFRLGNVAPQALAITWEFCWLLMLSEIIGFKIAGVGSLGNLVLGQPPCFSLTRQSFDSVVPNGFSHQRAVLPPGGVEFDAKDALFFLIING